jgi:hypothetical protein
LSFSVNRRVGTRPAFWQHILIEKYNPTVIPACPESVRFGGKDSGQAGMTEMGFVTKYIPHLVK